MTSQAKEPSKARTCCRKRTERKYSMRIACKQANLASANRHAELSPSPVKLLATPAPTTPRRQRVSDPKTKQRSVRFSTNVKVETRHVTEEDLKNSWFAGDDYVGFERDCGRTIAAIRKAWSLRKDGSPEYRLSAKEFTASGLEDMLTDELKRHRGFLKGRHHHHVLMEQHMQRTHGIVDPEQLQAVSQLFSTESCHIALERGNIKSY